MTTITGARHPIMI